MQVLNDTEINAKLKTLKGWNFSDNKIEKEFQLSDFKDALGFIIKTGVEAEKMDHHPDILLHSWNKVKIFLSTHNAGGVTQNDFNLAQKIEAIING